jgi:hypothetical protein
MLKLPVFKTHVFKKILQITGAVFRVQLWSWSFSVACVSTWSYSNPWLSHAPVGLFWQFEPFDNFPQLPNYNAAGSGGEVFGELQIAYQEITSRYLHTSLKLTQFMDWDEVTRIPITRLPPSYPFIRSCNKAWIDRCTYTNQSPHALMSRDTTSRGSGGQVAGSTAIMYLAIICN